MSFDLVGLPPSLEDIEHFAQHPSDESYAAIVDRLLSSEQFGERWGRHWLDVVRFAESAGNSRDATMPEAWRYRDYVIDALNADLPFDQFVREQIAGDLIEADNQAERDRMQIATGLLAIGSKSLNGGNLQMDIVDEQIDVISKSVLGLTVSCARCHDHKFDPIPTRDYYAMAGIFLSTQTLYGGGIKKSKTLAARAKNLLLLAGKTNANIKTVEQQSASLIRQQKALNKKIKSAQKKLPPNWEQTVARRPGSPKPVPKDTPQPLLAYLDLLDERDALDQRLEKVQRSIPFAVGVRDRKPVNCRVHVRGEPSQLGDSVPRGFLSCIALPNEVDATVKQSGRLQLADWLVHPDNPLTARVAVNRVWQHLFGRGIVETADNFGHSGTLPSHPNLLDYLAARFQQHWSIKQTIRQIVMSRTYRMSTDPDDRNMAIDPSNTFLWRMNRKRLEAEPLRDAMLAVSGKLDLSRPFASAVARIGEGEVGRGIDTSHLYRPFPHRSIYLPILRGLLPEILKLFDYPEPSNVQGVRSVTNVPAQSLYLMNSPFVLQQASALAQRVVSASDQDKLRVELLFRLVFGRPPAPQEMENARRFLQQSSSPSLDQTATGADNAAWTTLCHAFLAAAEFRYID